MKSSPFPFAALAAILFLFFISSCSRLDKVLYVETRPTKLVLHNNSQNSLYAAVFESRSARLSNWEPCINPLRCSDHVIAPGRSLDITYLDIYHWLPGADVIVHWYTLTPMNGPHENYQVVELSNKIVPTPRKSLAGS